MKFQIITKTLVGFNNLVSLLPAEAIEFKDYYPNEGNKSFTGILHLTELYKLKDLEDLKSRLSDDQPTVLPMGRRGKYDEYKTTIEKLEKDQTFCILIKKGTVREMKVYIYKGYNNCKGKYEGQSCEDINQYRYCKKGQLVIADPDGPSD